MYSKNIYEEGPSHNLKLPSRYSFGDQVIVFFGSAGIIKNCTIIKVNFTKSKVFYDVEVKWKSTLESAVWTDRLYNLDSANVYPPEDYEMLIDTLRGKDEIDGLNTELPPPFTPVIIKRKSGQLLFGFRTDAPVSEDPDASRNCHWHGNPLTEEMDIEKFSLKFTNSFSDVTVAGWVTLNEFVKQYKTEQHG